jgi:uncharacterized membrane protein (UPF0127 family)
MSDRDGGPDANGGILGPRKHRHCYKAHSRAPRPSPSKVIPTMLPRLAVLLALACAALSNVSAQDAQLDLPRTRLSAGMYQIDAQVAAMPRQREIGLMNRKEMPQAEGMLFVFEQPATQCFWMKNTLLPLTAAFVADDGRIVNLVDMQPRTLDSHCSKEPVRYVLEMNQGWFERKNIRSGARLGGRPFDNASR